jgi:tetratricopeptide (TPR) repeat protein
MLDEVRSANLAPAGAQRDTLTDRVLQDMGQVREAFRWSIQHDPATALALSAHAAGLVEFSAWRSEVFGWLRQCEALVDQAADRPLQAHWWRQFARHLNFLHDPRAAEAAAEATRLARDGDDALALFWALAVSVRAAAVAAPATNQAQTAAWMDEMTHLLQAHPAWPPEAEVFVLGARATLCNSIGDLEGALRHRQAEQALARRSGLTVRAAIAELNVGWTLNRLGRHADALAVFRAFIDAASAPDFNTAYAQVHAVRSLILLDRVDEALAAAPAALAASRRVNWLEMTGVAALLAARRGQLHTAALLLGHAPHSTVTLLARLRGLSTSVPRAQAV